MARFIKLLFVVGAATALSAFVAGYIVINGFLSNPIAPTNTQTIPYRIKGRVVYISQFERIETWLIYGGQVLGILLVIPYGARIAYRNR